MKRIRRRRGIILLLVLSLLALFALVGATFVIVSDQYQRGAKSLATRELVGDPPRNQLDTALYQLLRDTNNFQSSLFGHSLLGDLYGFENPWTRDTTVLKGYLEKDPADLQQNSTDILALDVSINLDRDDFTGLVLTMLDGQAAGLSTRIIRTTPNGLFVERFAGDDGSSTGDNGPVEPKKGDAFLINGRPFNGVGAGGYEINRGVSPDPTTFRLTMNHQADNQNTDRTLFTRILAAGDTDGDGKMDEPLPTALLPHYPRYLNAPLRVRNEVLRSGTDESYDAVDHQNMFLAMVARRDSNGMLADPGLGAPDIIPSFHRPELVHYWFRKFPVTDPSTQDTNSNGLHDVFENLLLPGVMFRPNWVDHPDFTGSNPFFDASLGNVQLVQNATGDPDGDGNPDPICWDIDNDGDGVPDSVWIDIGLPTQRTPDGRIYRPLVAILCIDMDGRLNVNAHDSIWSIAKDNQAGGNPFVSPAHDLQRPQIAGGPAAVRPRGMGYGPADIRLKEALGMAYEQLLLGRYGNDYVPGLKNSQNADEPLSGLKTVGMSFLANFGTPPDVHGRGRIALDVDGQPVYQWAGQPVDAYVGSQATRLKINEVQEDPYEKNLTAVGTHSDRLYPISQLESLLRGKDSDTNLNAREPLKRNLPPGHEALITTHSMDIPVPNVGIPPHLRNQTANSPAQLHADIMELYREKLRTSGVSAGDLENQLVRIFPFELRHGEKMNVNRLFGNGIDDDPKNYVVDEIGENGQIWGADTDYTNGLGGGGNGDGLGGLMDTDSRQIFARHLFCLTLLLKDSAFQMPAMQETGVPPGGVLEIRRIAQWAINVVDFRDSDAIMTGFECDANPWDGWDVDGNLSTVESHPDRFVVWGCEYPELLITETLAFHDRAVRDTDVADKRLKNGSEADPHLDQIRIPQGSLFVELYCTHNRRANNPYSAPPRELYNVGNSNVGLDLGRMAPPPQSSRRQVDPKGPQPVWRLAISAAHQGQNNPWDLRQSNFDTVSFEPSNLLMTSVATPPTLPIERYIWLGRPDANSILPAERHKYFYNTNYGTPGDADLSPGHYAVIGPRAMTAIGSTGLDEASPQRIILDPAANSLVRYDLTGSPLNPPVRRPLSIIVSADPPDNTWSGRRVGVSVSEPLPQAGSYYPLPTAGPPYDHRDSDQRGYYDDPTTASSASLFLDGPLDFRPNSPLFVDGVLETGTQDNYKTIFLQRLANPLVDWNPEPGDPFHDPAIPVNPYITVDWCPIDLSVFNGEDREPAGWDPATVFDQDPNGIDLLNTADPQGGGQVARSVSFGSRERSGENSNLWAQFSRQRATPTNNPAGGSNAYFEFQMEDSLASLNKAFEPAQMTADPEWSGAPNEPFPWLTWNNRPYLNPLELMLVPSSSPARLLHEFQDNPSNNYYVRGQRDPQNPQQDPFYSPYRHLLNFFNSGQNSGEAAHLYRIFDFLEVPSSFVGTEKWYNPSKFSRSGGPWDGSNPFESFRTPFNKLSRYRDPGRINLNTIFYRHVFEGLFDRGEWPKLTNWEGFQKNRRGYSGSGFLNHEIPSRFGNPYRAATTADLLFPPSVDRTKFEVPNVGVHATLLRSSANNAAAGPAQPDPPLFRVQQTEAYQDTDNPFFHYEAINRLGNLVTTHSNVFAVWITVGHFELQPGLIDKAHPDGYRLGKEIGIDTGEVTRHRGFYIIDRSVPVAFEPGQNHNVDKAVLLRRILD